MQKFKWKPYLWKIIWLVGLMIISNLSLHIESYFKKISRETYNLIPLLWSNLIVSVTFGIYISLIFVKKWSVNINSSLLCCVTIPCLIVSVFYPLMVIVEPIFGNLGFYVPLWLVNMTSLEMFGIIAGLTAILSIFNSIGSKL